jgi:hypothetical protein
VLLRYPKASPTALAIREWGILCLYVSIVYEPLHSHSSIVFRDLAIKTLIIPSSQLNAELALQVKTSYGTQLSRKIIIGLVHILTFSRFDHGTTLEGPSRFHICCLRSVWLQRQQHISNAKRPNL